MMLWILAFSLFSITEVAAFVPLQIATRHTTSLYGFQGDKDGETRSNDPNKDDNNGSDNASLDIENARQRLENLLSNPKEKTAESNNDFKSGSDDENTKAIAPPFSFSKILSDYEDEVDFSLSDFPPPPPLSSIERDRRLFEIKLLERLIEGDDGLFELWNHWYSERGSKTKSRLEQIAGMVADPNDWEKCERYLIELVDEYGIYFVEPVNLLATLYFLQGKLELSYKLCQIILTLKPYHVGALSGIVQVALGLNDPIAIREWAPKQLPRASTGRALDKDGAFDDQREEVPQLKNSHRIKWIKTAVATAERLLDEAERRTQTDFFGKPETYYDNVENYEVETGECFDDESDGSAWQ